jgi:hypothetical protein
MEPYKREFIDFMVRSGVLTFGDFVAKSGRKTPYFVNTGKYRTGSQLKSLARDNTGDTAPALAVFAGTWREFRPGIREYLGGRRANTRAAIGEEVHLERVDVLRIR